MKKKILGLYDSNIKYMEKLYKYLEDDQKIGFSICAFTSEEKLNDFLEKEKVDYLIASEDKEKKIKGVGKTIVIYEDAQNDGIFRYSPGDEVVDRLIDIIGAGEMEICNPTASKTKFIGVFSPVARSMKTSFCTVLGQMLAKKHRVLYLNFESFSGMSVSEQFGRRGDLSDVLYYFKNIRKEFISKFKNSIVSYNGLDMIKPAYYYLDLSYITPDIWDEFLTELSDMKEYDYIVMDLSDYLQGLFNSFLSRCSIVYTMTANDSRAQSKIFHYEQILNEYNHDDILKKTKKCVIPTIKNLPGEIDRLLYTELTDYVRKETASEFKW